MWQVLGLLHQQYPPSSIQVRAAASKLAMPPKWAQQHESALQPTLGVGFRIGVSLPCISIQSAVVVAKLEGGEEDGAGVVNDILALSNISIHVHAAAAKSTMPPKSAE